MSDNESDEYVVGNGNYQKSQMHETNVFNEACENTNVEVTSLGNYETHGKNNNNDVNSGSGRKSITRKDSINSNSELCISCNTKVYPMEKLDADGRVYHKTCFRCTKCRCYLSITNFNVSNNVLFCKVHFMERFKLRGRYDDDSEVQIDISSSTAYQMSYDEEPEVDDLPTTDTKTLLAKFRDLEENKSVYNPPSNEPKSTRYVQPSDEVVRYDDLPPDELPAPETTKSMVAKFKAMEQNKNVPTPENVRKMQEKAKVPALAHNNIRLVHQSSLTDSEGHIVRGSSSGMELEDEMPEIGTTRNLMNRFQQQ